MLRFFSGRPPRITSRSKTCQHGVKISEIDIPQFTKKCWAFFFAIYWTSSRNIQGDIIIAPPTPIWLTTLLKSSTYNGSPLYIVHHNMIPFGISSYITSKILDLPIKNYNIPKAVKRNLMLNISNQIDINQIICTTEEILTTIRTHYLNHSLPMAKPENLSL